MSDLLTLDGTISLGGLIQLLESRPQEQSVCFDFADLRPTGIDSYRGYYDHLAIGYCMRDDNGYYKTVADLLDALRAANGKTFSGYKGGDFVMGLHTPVWVSNWGQNASTAILGIDEREDFRTVLLTAHIIV